MAHILLFQIAMRIALPKTVIYIVFVVLLSSLAPPLYAQNKQTYLRYFDQAHEFPNLFLPEAYSNRAPHEVPESVTREAQVLLEQALGSIFDRLEAPIVEGETGEIKKVRYFTYLGIELRKIDPKIKIYPSGGVVRSAIGYLYDEMYRGIGKRLPQKPLEIHNSIFILLHTIRILVFFNLKVKSILF